MKYIISKGKYLIFTTKKVILRITKSLILIICFYRCFKVKSVVATGNKHQKVETRYDLILLPIQIINNLLLVGLIE